MSTRRKPGPWLALSLGSRAHSQFHVAALGAADTFPMSWAWLTKEE